MRNSSLIALAAGLLCAAAASGAINDPYINPGLAPPDPTTDPNGDTSWDGWQPLVFGRAYNIEAGGSIYLGLDNLYIDPSWIKNVTLEYEAVQGVIPGGATKAGYPPNSGQMDGPWDSYTHGFSGPTGRHLVEGVITPQSSWEWIQITNTDDVARPIIVIDFTSNCVPTPATFALVAMGGVACTRRRR